MKHRELIIENKEYDTLIKLIGMSKNPPDETYKASIEKLLTELKSAKKVSANDLPQDIVRFNSTVIVRFQNGQRRTIEIVFPEKSNVAQNKISILAPMSLALFGYAAGDKVKWQFPSGLQTIEILEVEQAAADLKKLES